MYHVESTYYDYYKRDDIQKYLKWNQKGFKKYIGLILCSQISKTSHDA